MSSVLLIEVDDTRGWVSPRRAKQMLRDEVAHIESVGPLVIRENPRIRVMRSRFESKSRSARYLISGGSELALYRRELRDTLQRSCQGKPGNVESADFVALEKSKSANRVKSPHGEGRE